MGIKAWEALCTTFRRGLPEAEAVAGGGIARLPRRVALRAAAADDRRHAVLDHGASAAEHAIPGINDRNAEADVDVRMRLESHVDEICVGIHCIRGVDRRKVADGRATQRVILDHIVCDHPAHDGAEEHDQHSREEERIASTVFARPGVECSSANAST